MQVVNNKVLIFKTRNPQKYSVIPKHKVLQQYDNGVFEVAVNWGLDEARVLRNMGVRNVPSPIVARYSWPGRFKPMEHQVITASFLTMFRRAFNFSEPGTGKTLSALWAADYLMEQKRVRRVLVISPVSIMHSAWMQDLENSILHRSAVVAHHSLASRRIEMLQGNYDFVIVNFDGVSLIADEIVADGRFDLIIVDEANAYKNPSTKRWKALKKIIKPDTMLWMMTGTPASQSPIDAYGLAKLVNPTGVPAYATAWRDATMDKVSMFKWVPKADAKDRVFKALQPAIRFTKEQCLDLPPVVTETRNVPLTPQQKKYYNLLRTQMLINTSGETISAVNKAAEINKLLQISAGAAYTDTSEVVGFDCTPRLAVLKEVIDETERKVLVFVPYRNSMETITAYLTKNGVSCAEIHGDVSLSKRTSIFQAFQTTDTPRVLVIQPKAASHGVTLTAADTVVFWGPVTSTETYIQCCARSDRKGQTSDKVTVIHIQGSEVEERLFKRLAAQVEDSRLLAGLYDEIVDKK